MSGDPSSACLRDPNTLCSWHLHSSSVCPHSSSARILRPKRSCLLVPPRLNRLTTPFSSLPSVMLQTGVFASARRARNAWTAAATRQSLLNPPISPTKPLPIPGPITPKTPPLPLPSPPTSPPNLVLTLQTLPF